MNIKRSLLLLVLVLALPLSVLAQPAEEPAGEAEAEGEGTAPETPEPVVAANPNQAVVVVTEAGDVSPASTRTARQLLADELDNYGIDIVDAPALDDVQPLSDTVIELARGLRARRIFEMQLSQLGTKLMVRIEEFDSDLNSNGFRKITARGIEELDLVLPRLVKALMEGIDIEDTATIDTVSSSEGRKWERRPGEFNWGLGIMAGGTLREKSEAAYGLNLKFSYEMEHVRLDVDIGGQFSGDGFFKVDVGAYYLPLTEFWTPYVGGGLGYMFVFLDREDMGNHGVGLVLAAGVEFFRLHRVRLIAEIGFLVPFFKVENDFYEYGRDGPKREDYVGMTYGMLSVLW